MRVLVVTPAFFPSTAYGGPIASTLLLTRALAAAGCQVRVLATNANGPRSVTVGEDIELYPGLTVTYVSRIGPHHFSPAMLWRLPRLVRWADVVYLVGMYSFPTVPVLLACTLLGRGLVWSPRGALLALNGSRRQRLKKIWNHACQVLMPSVAVCHCTSSDEAEATIRYFPRGNVRVVPNPVELPDAVSQPCGDSSLNLLALGRVHPIKGIENLIRACSLAAPRLVGRAWTLEIVGDGDPDYVRSLERLAAEVGIGARVVFVTHVDGAARTAAFARASVVIQASLSENFGMTVAEGLAHGRPVIASKGTPWKDLNSRGCGVWTESDPKSIADAILDMARADLPAMGRVGQEWIREEFGPARIARMMLKVFNEALAK